MSGTVSFDIRLPIGALFCALGALLFVDGLLTAGDADAYARSLSINVNLWWGIVMFAFGVAMLALAARARRRRSGVPR